MPAHSNLESLYPSGQTSDATTAFHTEYIDSTIGQRLVDPSTSDASTAPDGANRQAWAQISEMIGQGHQIQFTTGGEGQIPDYILGADGNLTPNPAKSQPSADGTVIIQVDSSQGKEAAAKVVQKLKVAAIEEKIAYWRRANPGSSDIPEFLKGELASAQSTLPTSETIAPQPQPHEQQHTQLPSIPSGGGGGGYRVGGSDVGRAPASGYRDGSFTPDAPVDRSALPQPVPGDLPIKGPPTCNVEQIQQFLEKMGSPAAREQGFSQSLYDACTQRGIDPAVAVGFFLQESTCGRYGRAVENHSLGNIKRTDGHGFRSYETWAEGARDWARLIDQSYVNKRGCETLSQVIGIYAPSSDGNNERGYVSTVKGVVEHFKKLNA